MEERDIQVHGYNKSTHEVDVLKAPLELVLLDAVCAGTANSPAKEDACGWSSNTAWVIDGGMPLDESEERSITSGRWLAQTASRHLQTDGNTTANVNDALVSTAQELIEAWPLYKNGSDLLPAVGCLSIARLSGVGAIELGAVGDCIVVLWNRNGQEQPTAVVTDTVLEEAERRWREAATAERGTLKDVSVHRYEMIANRLGYIKGDPAWIMSSDPIALELAAATPTITVPVEPGALMLLATNGFTRALSLPVFNGDWGRLLEASLDGGLISVLQCLRTAEESNPKFTDLEHKNSDDATALLLKAN